MKKIADLQQSVAERLDRPLIGAKPRIVELFPRDGSGDRRVDRRSYRVRTGQRLVDHVLRVVDPDLAGAALHLPDLGDLVRHQLRNHVRQLGDEATAFLQGVAPLDRDIDVQPGLAGGFEHRLELEMIERGFEHSRHGDHILESRAFGRIEVHHGPIGVFWPVVPRIPGMHVDHRVVREPRERRDFLDEDPVFEAFLVLVAEGGDPVRGVSRLVLHPVTLAVDAVRVRVHGERAVLVVRDHDGRHLDVIADRTLSSVLVLGEEGRALVGEMDDPAADFPISLVRDGVERLQLRGGRPANLGAELPGNLGGRSAEWRVGDVCHGRLPGCGHGGARRSC